MAKNDPQVEAAMNILAAAAEGLVQGGMNRESVARGMLLAALQVVHPITGLAGQAKWLRDMAQGLDLAAIPTEGMGAS